MKHHEDTLPTSKKKLGESWKQHMYYQKKVEVKGKPDNYASAWFTTTASASTKLLSFSAWSWCYIDHTKNTLLLHGLRKKILHATFQPFHFNHT